MLPLVSLLGGLSGAAWAGTPTLAQLCRASIDHAQETREAEAQARAASDRADRARGLLLPQVDAEAGASGWTKSQTTALPLALPEPIYVRPDRQQFAGVGLRQSVFDFGGRLNGWRDASEAARAADEERRASREDLVWRTADLAYRLLEAGEEARAAGASVERRSAYLADVRARRKSGAATDADVSRAEADVDAARASQIEAETESDAARRRLLALSGVDVSTLAVPDRLVAPPGPDAVEANPRVRAAGRRAEAAAKASASRAAALWPSLAVGGRYQHTDESPATILLVKDETFAYAALDWDLYAGGSEAAAADEARALREAADAASARLKRDLSTEAAVARDSLRRADALVDAQAAREQAARAAYEQADRRFRAGYGTFLARMDAETELTAAEAAHVRARFARERAVLGLLAARGGLEAALLK